MKKLVLFVHGLGGNPNRTWGSFEHLLRRDAKLHDISVGYFAYPTFLIRLPFTRRYPEVQTLATALNTYIEHRFEAYEDITLVCHSLGGLIGKQYLIDQVQGDRRLRISQVLFYAVPNHGAALAAIAKHISWRHPQLRQLCRASDVVRNIAEAWGRIEMETHVNTRYIIAAQDNVVDEHSARNSWSNDKIEVIPDKGHIDVVKPSNANDLAYLILKKALCRDISPTDIKPRIVKIPLALKEEEYMQETEEPIISTVPSNDEVELRVAISAVIRIEHAGKHLLIRNTHRPETFAPIGGVYKFVAGARAALDEFDFRQQAIDDDMHNDIRGFISPKSLDSFRKWFLSGSDRETSHDCLRRELREECEEVGLDKNIVDPLLRFRHVRTVTEGPEYIPSEGYKQFRIFEIYDVVDDTDASRRFLEELKAHSDVSKDLLWVPSNQIIKGRAQSGEVVAVHAAYLIGKRRYRGGDPGFVVK